LEDCKGAYVKVEKPLLFSGWGMRKMQIRNLAGKLIPVLGRVSVSLVIDSQN